MAKSRSFSVYLLKKGFDSHNALKDGHSLDNLTKDTKKLPAGAEIFIADNVPSDPWWKSYWGVERDLRQVSKGAVLFIPVEDKCFALTFGHTAHYLKHDSYEYDFGLRTTLNAIDPARIRATDIFQPEDAKRERVQSPSASDLTFFDINTDESIIKRLTGAVREDYKGYFRHVTGANNIRISSRMAANEIVKLCQKLLNIYECEDFKKTFPEIQNIAPVRDPSTIGELNKLLVKAFQEESRDVVLTIPEILDYENGFLVSYSGAHGPRKSYDDVFIGHYRDFLASRSIDDVNVDHLKHHRINIKDENGVTKRSFRIYECLLFDCELEGQHYHLCDGCWYRIEKDYLNKLKNSLDPYFKEHPVLKECDQVREDSHNLYVADTNAEYTCLDKTNISPKGQTFVEPCDLYTEKDGTANLTHIKISTRSAALSHLFNQGRNSVELLRLNGESRDILKALVKAGPTSPIDDKKFSVTYGIITAKDRVMKSNALPIFSRISLRRVIQSLALMAVECDVILIKDNVERKATGAK